MTLRNSGIFSPNRREFLGGIAAAGAAVFARTSPASATAVAQDAPTGSKPNSVFNGVHIGCITYSYRGETNAAEDTLKALLQDGLSETELMDGPIRAYSGISAGTPRGRRGGGPATRPAESDEQRAKQRE